ncbi:uncharacterized protein ycf45 isoform X2 [Salvia hispanica]|uniref:uncharacterized protein ycf45 isoform X2 n=1 Tax=Salvia hispanica TaxID=49212 RepID=UPI0020097BBD|nr:uncharacterized protein ycf45 isoform X2 [Salvia hispanica]
MMAACFTSLSLPSATPPPPSQSHCLSSLALHKNRLFSGAIRFARLQCHRCCGVTSSRIENSHALIDDDIHALLQILPHDLRHNLLDDSNRHDLMEVILDVGRPPHACYFGDLGRRRLRKTEVSEEELEYAQNAIGELGGDNRAGIVGTLHRISAIKNRKGKVIGLTCRVGRPHRENMDMVKDLLEPGAGKTTVMRGISRVLSDEHLKRVVIVDTSNEIGGDGDIPHPAIGGARRLQVSEPCMQHKVMIEAVENHMPEVIVVDEIGTEAEVRACCTIAQRGVMLIGSAHGKRIEDVIKNPTLCDLIGGLETVVLGDQEARTRNSKKSVIERRADPTFPFLIEMRERHNWVVHRTDKSVDALLQGKKPLVEVRRRDEQFNVVMERWKTDD